MARQSIRVTILGQALTIVAEDEAQTHKLAAEVDDLMHDIARRLPNADSAKIAVLACLHLADKLNTIERDLADLRTRVDRKSGELLNLLDSALSADSVGDSAGD
jgi:cell division protein ZapA